MNNSLSTSTQQTNDSSAYWVGPFEVLVSNNVERVTAHDGRNTLNKDGSMTKMCFPSLDKEEYLKRYAELRDDGLYYYVGRSRC